MELTKRQKEIVESALNLTASGGIQNLTIKNLADSIGITEPALYRHFNGKSAIVKAMIGSFDDGVEIPDSKLRGFDGIEAFARGRFRQVAENPALAKVMFAEELFMGDEEFGALMLDMMHRHKKFLEKFFKGAQKIGEVRSDISVEMLFRMVFGPVRLLIKQWGMSGGTFDIIKKGDELLAGLRKILK